MRLIITLLCLSAYSQYTFSETDSIVRFFSNYRISLERPLIQTSQTDELFISVFKDDLPITKLLLKYEGVLGEFFVTDLNKDNSFEVVLLLKNTFKNIRIFSLKSFELVEFTIGNQDLPNKNIDFLRIERKGDDIYRTLEVLDGERSYSMVQQFCFKELKWCDEID